MPQTKDTQRQAMNAFAGMVAIPPRRQQQKRQQQCDGDPHHLEHPS
jgi:hypothetical protein